MGCVVLAVLVGFPGRLAAQGGVSVSGTLTNSLTGEAIPRAVVQIDELRVTTTSNSDGLFTFPSVPPGTYHLSVRTDGYSTRRTEVIVATTAVTGLAIRVDPELHFAEQTTVTGDQRSTFDVYQPASVLAGQELQKEIGIALGDTLQYQPGVAVRSLGPANSRPVIRGMDGDRVQILEDGQRTNDLSSTSPDHAVIVNPAAAPRIEIVRGPATLLYGPSVIGGLVNLNTELIPTKPVNGVSGSALFNLGTAANEAGGATDIRAGNGRFAFRAGGGGLRNSDYASPEGDVINSQSRTAFGNVGLSWTGEKSYVGGSYSYDDINAGIPVLEDGIIETTPRRHSFSLRAGGEGLSGVLDAYRATLSVQRYKHDELEAGEVGTAFKNDTEEVELMAGHRAAGRLRGRFGGWFLNRAFSATGEESLSPPVDQNSFAAFVYEEMTWPHVSLQFAGRLDHTKYTPTDLPENTFTTGSGSVGLLFTPEAASERLTFAVSLAATARPPSIDELYFFGLHHATNAIEIGNPFLDSERAIGLDLSMRWRGSRTSGEITYFRNSVNNFIFRNSITEEEFEEREEEFEEWHGRPPAGHDHEHEEGEEEGGEEHEEPFFIEYVARDAVLHGFEAHADFAITSRLFAEVGADYVLGSQKDSDDPLPRIPPFRFRGGLRYQYAGFQAGGEVIAVSDQDRVYGVEEPTDGYNLLRLFGSYSFQAGGATHTFTARLDNATNEDYRNHLSYLKEFVPEMGRNFKVVYGITF
jgi:iron complex outermembrane receptor protein